MLRKMTLLVTSICWLAAAGATAQTDAETALEGEAGPGIEVTLFAGLLISDSLAAPGAAPKLDLDEDVDFGIALSLPTSFDNFKAEIIYFHNQLEMTAVEPGRPRLTEIDQQVLHLGGLWELNAGRHVGFATASVGVADLDPQGTLLSSETLASASLGGGGKLFVNERVGFRLEGRILAHAGDASMFCNPATGCLARVSGSLLVQFQAAAGLVLTF